MQCQRTLTLGVAGFLVLTLVMAGLFALGCKPSHRQAKQVRLTESELSTPGLSAEQKKLCDERLEWNMETLADAYERVGSQSPKWNLFARDALILLAQVRAYGPDVEGYPHALQYKLRRALEAGCDDPLMGYLQLRFRFQSSAVSADQVAQDYAVAADRLGTSTYPAMWKFYGAARAYRCYFNGNRSNSAFQQSMTKYHFEAASRFFEFLEGKRPPVAEVDEACRTFLGILDQGWSDKKDLYDRTEKLLLKNWPKEGFAYYVRGQFYVDYAWEGRSSKVASKVTPEQWKLFRERLAVAESILTEGMAIAPKEGRLPTLMIKVVSGQGKGLEEMKRWFDKAMEADTNNLAACKDMLYFLLPRWYGSREAMIAFGRHCLASEKWGGTVPLALVEAHYTYNRYDGAPDGSYWRQPDVWPDIKASYEKFFSLNPKAISWRSYYARYAYWCRQRETLREQLALLGDNVDEDAFGGSDAYQKAVEFAKEQSTAAR